MTGTGRRQIGQGRLASRVGLECWHRAWVAWRSGWGKRKAANGEKWGLSCAWGEVNAQDAAGPARA